MKKQAGQLPSEEQQGMENGPPKSKKSRIQGRKKVICVADAHISKL